MLQEISKITGLPFNDTDPSILFQLRRIERKLPIEINVDLLDRRFVTAVKKAAAEVDAEGPVSETIVQQEGPRVLKIKSSPKGKRIDVPAPNGTRYSFGPVWNGHVINARGPAIAESNRVKLEFHAQLIGVAAPFPESLRDLCALMAPILQKEEAA